MFDRSEHQMKVVTIPFESLITRARNAMFTGFFNSDFDSLLFIDADIIFNPNDVVKLIKHDKELICGVYPKKSLKFDKMKNAVHKTKTIQELIPLSTGYAHCGLIGDEGNDVIEVKYAPTGFMMISRSAAVKLTTLFGNNRYGNDVMAYTGMCKNNLVYNFFNTVVSDGKFLSEDYSFCKLCSRCGIKIHVDKSVKLTHVGLFYYHGNYKAYTDDEYVSELVKSIIEKVKAN
jgi:hypothetical protein